MIVYHGTPIGGSRQDAARFLRGRHALVPHFRPEDLPAVAEFCASFIFDNSAFTAWTQDKEIDIPGYTAWVELWSRHPGFDWALIPDTITGSAADNDAMIRDWPRHLRSKGVPVWHLHEDPARLERLVTEWPIVALGSSGQWKTPGTDAWWHRITDAMAVACDSEGRPKAQLHGLRMADPAIFTRLPVRSVDSTNAAVNSGSLDRFGMYLPPTSSQRAAVIADRIEAFNSAPVWVGRPQQQEIFA